MDVILNSRKYNPKKHNHVSIICNHVQSAGMTFWPGIKGKRDYCYLNYTLYNHSSSLNHGNQSYQR